MLALFSPCIFLPSIENAKPISEGQLQVKVQVLDEERNKLKSMQSVTGDSKCGWLVYQNTNYFFVLTESKSWFNSSILSWYLDDNKKNKVDSKMLKHAKFGQISNALGDSIKLVIGKK